MLKGFTAPLLRTTIPQTLLLPPVARSYALRTTSEYDEDTIGEARRWLAGFDNIPERMYDVTYSRSSGPGGQNVNK